MSIIDHHQFLEDYFRRYRRALLETDVSVELIRAAELVRKVKSDGGKLLIAGNGGSASIASHAAVDFTKQARVKAMSLASDALITAFANDYGYDEWLAKGVEAYAEPGDLLVLISSSGRSANILKAASVAGAVGLELLTFSGFDSDNPLRSKGSVDFWVDSRAYNVVECTHQIWLLTICDLVIGKAEYAVT